MVEAKAKRNRFKDKKVLVVGLARSGTGAANLLASLGAKVSITDTKTRSALEANIRMLEPSVNVITGGNPEDVFLESDLIVLSPGVPPDIPPLVLARAKGIPIIGELELAFQVAARDELRLHHHLIKGLAGQRYTVKDKGRPQPGISAERVKARELAKFRPPLFIGVTGTNGKSTTTTLIDLMLRKSGFRTLLGGNIGNSLTEGLNRLAHEGEVMNVDYVVAEVSSFQLEAIKDFRPKVATILNITSDHLDRYKNMMDYIEAKAGIFRNQTTGDFLIFNADDPLIMELYRTKFSAGDVKRPEVFFFSRKKDVRGIYLKGDMLYYNFPSMPADAGSRGKGSPAISRQSSLMNINEIKIEGVHNLENAMAASAVSFVSGCSWQDVMDVLRDFKGLEHRLEHVGEINGIRFINDSKGTNTGAVRKSLESFDNVLLIMGGMDKRGDFSDLLDLVEKKVKALIVFGEAKGKIAGVLGKAAETLIVDDIREAVKTAVSRAVKGDIVLLSPGCASFDMFADFEERGRRFKEAVREIAKRDRPLFKGYGG
jgi:UDP-N-acetylmuramoylalanine--D-glutamate ligase